MYETSFALFLNSYEPEPLSLLNMELPQSGL